MHYAQPPLSLATRKYLETQFKLFADLSRKTLHGVEQLADLNVQSAKMAIEESTLTARQFIAVRQPHEVLSLLSSQVQPNTQKAFSYGSRLINITATTQAELTLVAQARIAEISRSFNKLMTDVTHIAPVAPEKLLSLMTHALASASADAAAQAAAQAGYVKAEPDRLDAAQAHIESASRPPPSKNRQAAAASRK